MIRIFSGWGNVGGSTVAFINLVNLLNSNNHEATFYSPHDWAVGKCRAEKMDAEVGQKIVFKDPKYLTDLLEKEDIIICHFLPLSFENAGRGFFKKCVYSSHETDIWPVKSVKRNRFDFIHYVSEFQRDWHKIQHVPNVVIPNVMSPLNKLEKTIEFKKVAGVVVSIDSHKKTHKSINKALEDGCDKVLVFGAVTQIPYWDMQVSPLIEDDRVEYCGVVDDKSFMYSNLDVVYHSSPVETFNYIERECKELDIPYIHTERGRSLTEKEWNDTEILDAWGEALCL